MPLWVPSHCGRRDNIEADKLARIGANGGSHNGPECIVNSGEFVKKLKNRWINRKFARQEGCWGFARGLTPHISKNLELDRKRLKAAIRAISGHCFTRSPIFILSHADDDLYRWCRLVKEIYLNLIRECLQLMDLPMANLSDGGPIIRNIGPDRLLGGRPIHDQFVTPTFFSLDRL